MQHILAFFQEALKIGLVFFGVDLGGAGVRAIGHRLIELVKGNGLTEIVGVLFAIQLIVEADVTDVAVLEVFEAEVCGGTAAENEICHWNHSLS